MQKFQDFLEALKPSEYRKYMKNFNRERYSKIFTHGDRIYIPFTKESSPVAIQIPSKIEQALSSKGYKINDYKLGIAQDSSERQIKIGKALNKVGDKEALEIYEKDPQRNNTKVENQLYAVISRHPYDIAGMSTDRGWTSCMNLRGGINKHYVMSDVKYGTIIAYCVKNNDKNINAPLCRVLIKPFVDEDDENDIFLQRENRVYGTNQAGFTKVVDAWVNKANDGINSNWKKLHAELYCDGDQEDDLEDDEEALMDAGYQELERQANQIFDDYETRDVEFGMPDFHHEHPFVQYVLITNFTSKNNINIDEDTFVDMENYYFEDGIFNNVVFATVGSRVRDTPTIESGVELVDCDVDLASINILFSYRDTIIMKGGNLTVDDNLDPLEKSDLKHIDSESYVDTMFIQDVKISTDFPFLDIKDKLTIKNCTSEDWEEVFNNFPEESEFDAEIKIKDKFTEAEAESLYNIVKHKTKGNVALYINDKKYGEHKGQTKMEIIKKPKSVAGMDKELVDAIKRKEDTDEEGFYKKLQDEGIITRSNKFTEDGWEKLKKLYPEELDKVYGNKLIESITKLLNI